MKQTFFLAAIGSFLMNGTVFAGDALDMAKTRVQAIASGDVTAITEEYGDSFKLEWIGGPLNGTYTDRTSINEVWGQFAKVQGDQTVEIRETWEAENPAGSTVALKLTFNGKSAVPVLYLVTYRDGELVNEVWQVTPSAR